MNKRPPQSSVKQFGNISRISPFRMVSMLVIVLVVLAMLVIATQAAAQANNSPQTQPDQYSTALNTPINLVPDILDNDTDPDGDPINLASFNQPLNGSLVDSGGILTYTPDTGFEGLDSFIYTISDGTDNSLGKAFIEVGNPNIDLFQIGIGDTVSNGVPDVGAGNIEIAGASDVYIFQGETGQEIIFDWLSGSQLMSWRLEAPNGSILFGAFWFDQKVLLPETGTYTLKVNGGAVSNIGIYSIRLLLTPPPQAFSINIGDSVSDAVPTVGAGNIEVPGAVDIYTFDGIAGEEVIFDWTDGSNVLVLWRLEAPDGTELFDTSLADHQVLFSQTGTYTLVVAGRGIDDVDTYAFRLLSVPAAEAFSINIGDSVSDGVPAVGAGNLEVPGAVDIYTFDGVASEGVIFDWTGGSNVLVIWRLEAPDGTEIFDTSLADHEVRFEKTGTYTLTVDGRGIDDVDTYAFQLAVVPPPEEFVINIGDAVSDGVPAAGAGNIEDRGAIDIYTFTGVAGEEIIVDWLTGSNVLLIWQLEAPDGTELFNTALADHQVLFFQTGTYTLTVDGRGIDDIGTYSFQLLSVPSSADQFAINIGDSVSDGVPAAGAGNIEVPGAVDIYTFAATAGEEIIFDWTGGSNTLINWRLEAPDRSMLFDTILQDHRIMLPQTGTYYLIVRGRGVDDVDQYAFQLLTVPSPQEFVIDFSNTVSDGVPSAGAGNIEAPGGVDIYTFDAVIGQEALFDQLSGNFVLLGWHLEAPDGTILFDDILVDQQLTLDQTGTYRLVVDGNLVGSAGIYSFKLIDVLANDAPVAIDDSPTTDEDTVVTIDVLVNDTDIDGDSLIVDSITEPSNGIVTNNGSDVTYTPNLDFNGIDTFTYIVSDGNGGTDEATVTVTVNPVNDNPVATDDESTTDEDSVVTIDVLVNDTDIDGDVLSVDSVTQPTNGTVANNGLDVTYTPNLDFNGIDSFTYLVSDGNGGTDEATVTITINPVNDAPIATDDEAITDEDVAVTIDVLSNDTDVDGDILIIDSLTEPSNGTVTNNGLDVTYTPNLDFNGTDSFTYIVSDSNDGTDEATVTITVNPVNDAPIATDDSAITDEDVAITIDVLSNDTDVDGDILIIDSLTEPSNGTVTNNGLDVTYTPNLDFNGTDSFTYIVSDSNDGTDEATVTITVNPVNDAPIATDDESTTDEDSVVTIDVLVNDTDIDGDVLSVDSVTQPTNGTVANNGLDVTYTPNLDFNGIDSFTYLVSDGNGGTDEATVTITINPVNDNPVATDDEAITDEDVAVTIDVLSNDTDVDGDTLVVDSVTEPSNGTVTNNGLDIAYTPNLDFNGTDSFTYIVSDGNGGTDEALVTVTINPVNDAPVATNDSATTDEDVAITIDVLSNDTDVDGDTLVVDSVTEPSNGTVTNNGLDVTYTPNLDFNGTDSFTYIVSDGNGGTDEATVTITINPVNDAPVATDDSTTTDEDVAVTIDVLSNDTDVDGDVLVVDSVIQPTNGTVTNNGSDVTYTPNLDFNGTDSFTYIVSDNNGGTDEATVTVTINPVNDAPVATDDSTITDEDIALTIDVLSNDTDVDGDVLVVDSVTSPSNGTVTNNGSDVTYTPNLDFNGTDSFTYIVSDGNGGTDEATVTITINPVNDAPVAADDSATTDEDVAVTIDVLSNDSDVDGDILSVDSVTQATNGTVVNNGVDVAYTPNLNFNGVDSFTYIVSDGNGGTDEATVTVTVNLVNDNPVATDDEAITDEDVAVTIDILSNDSDVDGDTLVVDSVIQPANGTVTNNGSDVTYTPNLNFNGTDSFTYIVSDGNGGTDEATVTVYVSLINSSPIATDDEATTDEDVSVTIDVLVNDTDMDGDTLVIDSLTQPSNGIVTNNGSDVTYTPNLDFNGGDSFTYIISDGNGGTDEALVTVTVNPVNDNPVATDDSTTTDENVAVTIDVLANDTDIDGDTLTVDSVTQPTNGTVTNNGSDVIYTPNSNFNGSDAFTYVVSDGNSGTDEATVTIFVNSIGFPPTANDDIASTDEDIIVTIDVLLNDTDVDGDTLTVESVTQPANGTVTNNGLDVTYTPNLDFNGTDTFTYIVSDGNDGTDEATVMVEVVPVNDAPTVTNPSDQMNNEGDNVTLQIEASDPDGDILTFAATGLPDGLTIDINSGLISGNLGDETAGNYNVSVDVSDSSETVETEFLWTVFDVSTTDVCYATEVVSYQSGTKKNGHPIHWLHANPNRALGAPQDDYGLNYVSLGFGDQATTGVLVLGFSPAVIVNDNGDSPDVRVWETTNHWYQHWITYPERARVEASQDGINWVSLGITSRNDQSFDLGSLEWASYIRLTDVTNRRGWRFDGFANGFDVDAVEGFACSSDVDEPVVAVPGQWVESDDDLVSQDGWWGTIYTQQASGDSYLYTVGDDSQLSLQFIGTSVEVIYPKHLTLGAFTVIIDNVAVRTVVQWGWHSEFQRRAVFEYLEPGMHTIEIVPVGGVTAIDAFYIPD